MLDEKQKEIIISLVNESLNKAENHWTNGGYLLASLGFEDNNESMSRKAEAEPSKIPGHPIVRENETVIDEFIALVADIRNSSEHLMCARSHKHSSVSGIQRIYYETSALLPALAQAINFDNGNVTEYLGDGILALFKVDSDDRVESIYAAHRAAKNCIKDVRDIVNTELAKRYELPALDIGVGLAMSQTIVTLVGLKREKHPKAIGECIYRATKLSDGNNEIYIDAPMKSAWPIREGGSLSFRRSTKKGFDGYLIEKLE